MSVGRARMLIYLYTQSADRTVSSFVDSSAQHRENEAESDGNVCTCFLVVVCNRTAHVSIVLNHST